MITKDALRGPVNWRKSSRSKQQGDCVEVGFAPDAVGVRDSKDRGAGPVLSVPARHWARFLDEVAGRAPVGSNTLIQIVVDADGGASLRAHGNPGNVLSYTPGEWSAFVAGVRSAEFDLPCAEVLAA